MSKKTILILFLLILCFLNSSLASSPPATFVEEDIVIPIKDNLKLDGKITYPETPQKTFPAVLLLHGSGKLNMDMTMKSPICITPLTQKEVKPFKRIAEYLSSRGFLVLRYNKRIYQYPKLIKKTKWKDILDDAESALKYLRNSKLVDKNKIFIVGISQGTIIGTHLAIKNKNIAGLVLMSALSRDLRDALRYQLIERETRRAFNLIFNNYDINEDQRISKEEADKMPSWISFPFKVLDINHDNSVDKFELRALFEHKFYANVIFPEVYKSDNLPVLMKVINEVEVPILFLHGEKDEQTPLFELYALIFVLEQNKKDNFQYKIFPGVGHVFSPPIEDSKYGEIPTMGPIQTEVLECLCEWLKSHT